MLKITRGMLRRQPLAPECLEANVSSGEMRGVGWTVVGCYGLWQDGIPDIIARDCHRCPAYALNDAAMLRRVREILGEVEV